MVHASRPVPRTLTGCVLGGQFYSIHVNQDTGKPSQAYPIRFRGKPDLSAYEGKTITVEGWLSPGDAFSLKEGTRPAVIHPGCSNDHQKVIRRRFLVGYVVAAHKAANRNDFGEAFRFMGKALEMDPTDCQSYIDRAYIYYLHGNSGAGDRDIKFVMTRGCPDSYRLNFLIMDDVAKVLLRNGRKAEALDLYRFALDTCTSDICRDTIGKEMQNLKGPGRR
jgi:tetratricopeptide (TPR) repeat protein